MSLTVPETILDAVAAHLNAERRVARDAANVAVTPIIVSNIVVGISCAVDLHDQAMVEGAFCIAGHLLSLGSQWNFTHCGVAWSRSIVADALQAMDATVLISSIGDALKALASMLTVTVTAAVDADPAAETENHVVLCVDANVVGGTLVPAGCSFSSKHLLEASGASEESFKSALDVEVFIGTSATSGASRKCVSGRRRFLTAPQSSLETCHAALNWCDAALRSDESSVSHHDVTLTVFWPQEVLVPLTLASHQLQQDAYRRRVHRLLCLPNRPRLVPSTCCVPSAVTVSAAALWRWKLIQPQTTSAHATHVTRYGAPWERHLVCQPHLQLQRPSFPASVDGYQCAIIEGPYDYYHYRVDGFVDDGWGCAYRSLQTVVSWFQYQGYVPGVRVPSVTEIQRILKRVDFAKESQPNFVGSKEWIGSFEVMLVLSDALPHLECQMKRLDKGSELETNTELHQLLLKHFSEGGCPIMIGGSSYAHTILGIEIGNPQLGVQYLILDPHYSATVTDMKIVKQKGWCGWKRPSKFFEPNSFYNLCIPKLASADFS